jgi:transposase InsO family protein
MVPSRNVILARSLLGAQRELSRRGVPLINGPMGEFPDYDLEDLGQLRKRVRDNRRLEARHGDPGECESPFGSHAV